eukprot:937801-Rhodomonas_salina.2
MLSQYYTSPSIAYFSAAHVIAKPQHAIGQYHTFPSRRVGRYGVGGIITSDTIHLYGKALVAAYSRSVASPTTSIVLALLCTYA